MGMNSYWLVEGKVIYSDATGDISMEELDANSQRLFAMIEESPAEKVHH